MRCRIISVERKEWYFNRRINNCRIYTDKVLLPKDLHNPITPPVTLKQSRNTQGLIPYTQLIIDLILISIILYCTIYIYIYIVLDYAWETQTTYKYSYICIGILLIFLLSKMIILIIGQMIASGRRTKNTEITYTRKIIDKFLLKCSIIVSEDEMSFDELIEKVSNISYRKEWEIGVANITENKDNLTYTYVLSNMNLVEINVRRVQHLDKDLTQFILYGNILYIYIYI